MVHTVRSTGRSPSFGARNEHRRVQPVGSLGNCRFGEEEQFHVRDGSLGSQRHGPCSRPGAICRWPADGIDRQTIDGELQEFETFGEFQRAIDRAGRFHVEEGRAQAAAVGLPGVAYIGLDDPRRGRRLVRRQEHGLPGLANDFILHRIVGGRLLGNRSAADSAGPRRRADDRPNSAKRRTSSRPGRASARRWGRQIAVAATGGPVSVKVKSPEIAADGESTRLARSSEPAANVPAMAGLVFTLSFHDAGTSNSMASSSPSETCKLYSHVGPPLVFLARDPRHLLGANAGTIRMDRYQHGRRGGRIGIKRPHRPSHDRLGRHRPRLS